MYCIIYVPRFTYRIDVPKEQQDFVKGYSMYGNGTIFIIFFYTAYWFQN